MIAKADTTRARRPETKPEPKKDVPKKKRKATLGVTLGVLLGLCELIGSRLGHLWVAFDVMSQFTMQFLFWTVAFLLAWFVPRLRVLTAIVLFVSMSVAYGVWPHLVSGNASAPAPAVAAKEKALKIASFNTYRFNQDFSAQIASIRKLNADAVVLIELDPPKKSILEGLKDIYPHQFACFDQAYCFLAIISKTPLTNTSAQAIWEGSPYIRATLGAEFGNVTLVGTHTTRFPHSRAQLKQVRALVRSLESVTGKIILTGDFNATPFSRVTSTIAQGAGLVRHTSLPTWPAQLNIPQIAIDHMFASPALRPLTSEMIGDAAGSDHFPITMSFAVPVAK